MTIMLTGLNLQVMRTLLILARADAGLLALVPSDHIDPDGVKVYPIITFTDPRALPVNRTCVRGSDGSIDVHAFAGPTPTLTGRDHIHAIGARIETVFAPNRIQTEDGSHVRLFFSDVRIFKDEAPDDWHWFGQLNIAVIKAFA